MRLVDFPWVRALLTPERVSEDRVLIVADDSIAFNEIDLGLSELCKAVKETDMPWEGISLTTAHRSDSPCKAADISNFRFDRDPDSPHLPFSIENYDQVWLFGYAGSDVAGLSDSELERLTAFMAAGGGVFATGDHEDLGASLCAGIPRVRSMRMWKCPPAPGTEGDRIDTLRLGDTKGFQRRDQSDGTPQEIRPRFYMEGDSGDPQKNSYPHPLLALGDFAVTVLPDHMHEGICTVPNAAQLQAVYGNDSVMDFPLSDDGSQVIPEVVAIATSAGGYLTDVGNMFPVEPRSFPIIVAYDGQEVSPNRLGRIVVDSSFHHFVDINLNGTGSPNSFGFYDEHGNPTESYKPIKQYYRNIVSWLRPLNKQVRHYLNLMLGLRYMSPLNEEIRARRERTSDQILHAGVATWDAICERTSKVEAAHCALVLTRFLPDESGRAIRALINPWRPNRRDAVRSGPIVDSSLLLKVVLGSSMLGIADHLPGDPCDVASALHPNQSHEEVPTIESLVTRGLRDGLSVFTYLVNSASSALRVAGPRFLRNPASNDLLTHMEEETMASKCSATWKSVRSKGGSVVAEEIVTVYADGMHGHHEKGQEVAVGCGVKGMTWDIPEGSPIEYHYYGDFDGLKHGKPHEEDHITGYCQIFKVDNDARTKDSAPDDVEDWEGTKTT